MLQKAFGQVRHRAEVRLAHRTQGVHNRDDPIVQGGHYHVRQFRLYPGDALCEAVHEAQHGGSGQGWPRRWALGDPVAADKEAIEWSRVACAKRETFAFGHAGRQAIGGLTAFQDLLNDGACAGHARSCDARQLDGLIALEGPDNVF